MPIIFISMKYISQVISPESSLGSCQNQTVHKWISKNFFMGNSALKILQSHGLQCGTLEPCLLICPILEQTQNCFLRKIFILSMSIVLPRPPLYKSRSMSTQDKV